MTKKILIAILFAISILCCSTIVFAAENTTSLGNEVDSSIRKTEDSTGNMTRNAGNGTRETGNTVKNGVEDVGNAIKNGVEDIGNGITDGFDENNEARTNNSVPGTTGNYTSAQAVDGRNNTGMSGTTWIWMVLAVVAIIIVAAVWYYVAQND